VVLDKLDPRALTWALLGPRRRRRRGRFPAGVRDYPARRAAQEAKALARGGLRAVAVDGKTSRGARRAGGTRVHLLGAAAHGGRLLDHLEVDIKHNETSHFTPLPEPLDMARAVVTFDALHTVRANLDWLTGQKKAQYIAVVKKNQPLLHARVKALPWRQVPAGSLTRDAGHGRLETRTLKTGSEGEIWPHLRATSDHAGGSVRSGLVSSGPPSILGWKDRGCPPRGGACGAAVQGRVIRSDPRGFQGGRPGRARTGAEV
jgi:hypothetical protein